MVVVDSASAVHSLAPKKLPLGPTGWNHLSVEMMHQVRAEGGTADGGEF